MTVKLFKAKSLNGLYRIPVNYIVWVDDSGYFGITKPKARAPHCAYENLESMLGLKGLGLGDLSRLSQ